MCLSFLDARSIIGWSRYTLANDVRSVRDANTLITASWDQGPNGEDQTAIRHREIILRRGKLSLQAGRDFARP
jgi:hypothetical protein